jgi:hypothetical protein
MITACRVSRIHVSTLFSTLLVGLLLGVAVEMGAAAQPATTRAWQAVYRGSLVPRKEEEGNDPQPFTLQLMLTQRDTNQWQLDWLLKESGRAQWPWPSQFGTLTWQDQDKPVATAPANGESAGPSLLHPHDERQSTVRFPGLLIAGGSRLASGQSWQVGKDIYRVAGSEKVSERACWKVTVTNNYGLQRTLWVEKGQPLVLAGDSRVVLGQGKEHRLQFAMAEHRPLTTEMQKQVRQAFDTMVQLREKLQVKPGNKQYAWTDKQLKILRETLPGIRRSLRDTPLFEIAQLATQDVSKQKNRKITIAAITKRTMGKQLSSLPLQSLKGKPFPEDGLENSVVVLHFWEYRDKPLEAPYGQVGYLDFLYQKYHKQGLKVYGVASDLRLADPEQRPGAIRGVKRLVEFMNLSYPVMADSAGYLQRLGDPRAAEARLPLFVVLDRQSKVIHYHVGYYEVQRDRGLETLDTVVKKALGK